MGRLLLVDLDKSKQHWPSAFACSNCNPTFGGVHYVERSSTYTAQKNIAVILEEQVPVTVHPGVGPGRREARTQLKFTRNYNAAGRITCKDKSQWSSAST